jgi:hypothetical protein
MVTRALLRTMGLRSYLLIPPWNQLSAKLVDRTCPHEKWPRHAPVELGRTGYRGLRGCRVLVAVGGFGKAKARPLGSESWDVTAC